MITYISRQFFKSVQDDTFVLVEAFFPTNRGRWKRHSSWVPEEKEKASGKGTLDTRFPQDVIVKKGYSWSEQVAIAMAALQEAGEEALIEWTKDVSTGQIIWAHFTDDGRRFSALSSLSVRGSSKKSTALGRCPRRVKTLTTMSFELVYSRKAHRRTRLLK